MIGSRRAWRTMVAFALGLMGTGLVAGRSSGQDQAASLSASFRRAAARVQGAVVSVRIPDVPRPPGAPVPPRIERLGPAAALIPRLGREVDADLGVSWSGVVIDADRGRILTSEFPTYGAPQLVVTFADGAERLTTEVRHDPRSDLALLVVDPKGLRLQQANWGDPDKLEAGDWLIALGRPGVGPTTMSAGIFSARRRLANEVLIETDATIPGVGAGGALVNLDGDLVGIGRLAGRRRDGLGKMSHAIPADWARRVAADLAQFGRVRRAVLGVQVDPAPTGRRSYPPGVRVSGVGAGSPAAEAGLRLGDLIITVGRHPVDHVVTLQQVIEQAPIGQPMTLTIEREGRSHKLNVQPREMSSPGRPAGPNPPIETGRDAIPGRPDDTDSPPGRPPTPVRPSTPDDLTPPDPIPPRPEGAAGSPLLSPGTVPRPPGR